MTPPPIELDFVTMADDAWTPISEPVSIALAELLKLVPGIKTAHPFPPDQLGALPAAVVHSPGFKRPGLNDNESVLHFEDWMQEYTVAIFAPVRQGKHYALDALKATQMTERFMQLVELNSNLGGACDGARVVNVEPPDVGKISDRGEDVFAIECDVEVLTLIANARNAWTPPPPPGLNL